MKKIDKLKASLRPEPKTIAAIKPDLSSGLIMLNLGCTGNPNTCLRKGSIYVLAGVSMGGKTWTALLILAEASISSSFEDYRLILDQPERGALMSLSRFGQNLVDRIEPPNSRGHSRTQEEFYDNVIAASKDGRPFIYVLDSEDALVPEADIQKQNKNSKARRKINEGGEAKVKGSFGMDKAKINSSGMRNAHNALEDTGSILIVIKQLKQNVNPHTAKYQPYRKSGGLSLTYYATCEFWFHLAGAIKRTVRGKPRTIGHTLKIVVKKNREQGTDPIIYIPFYPSTDTGMDDIGSMCDFLIDEGHWSETKGKITADEFDFQGSEEKLIQHILDNNLEKDLKTITTELWQEIQEACKVNRKSKYNQ